MDRTWSGDGAAVVAGLPLLTGAPRAGVGAAQQRKEGQQGESDAHRDVHCGLYKRGVLRGSRKWAEMLAKAKRLSKHEVKKSDLSEG